MRVLLNGLTALKPRTGIGQYTVRLSEEMKQLLPGEFEVYPPRRFEGLAKKLLTSQIQNASQSHHYSPSLKLRARLSSLAKQAGLAAIRLHFANHCRSSSVTIYHEPNYLPLTGEVPSVITVHDLSVILHPEWHPVDRVQQHGKLLESAIANAAHIITDTEQVRRETMSEFGVSEKRITAIHLGVSPEFRPMPRLPDMPESYFLSVGTIEPRKNLLTVMKAFISLSSNIRERCPLLLVGPWGWKADSEYAFFEKHQQLGIRHLGYMPDSSLPSLYSGATVTLYPSLYEGFGLPPLEAIACGGAAICSTGTLAVREVMGTAAVYCEAMDIDAWRAAMLASLETRRDQQSHAKHFTWARTASETLSVYNRVQHGESSRARAA